ncbi:PARP-domain-containing protein [Choiromyces venosus 120613-1]|uniref:Poly [ADP-ribose] polymerase n=1 Tax=Choiromyces venosus 120613-1 TaxID=1336337 RepID=A0A3N4JAE0_9PEZI|nr:PARP-domain-containing protein [Choiromyces venosus 120613-1]
MTFNNLVVAVSGTHKGYTQAKLEKLITTNGGSFAKVIDKDVTHLVTTQVDYDKGSIKVKSAKEVDGLQIVNLDWLLESIEGGKKCDEKGYLIGDGSAGAGSSSTAAPAPAPAATKAKAEELPKKRTRGKAASPPPAAKVAAEEESEEETKPAAKKAKALSVGKSKGKGKAKEEPKDEEEEEEKEKVKKMKTVVKKGKAPVDELCPIAGQAHVYVDPSGIVYDATLNQANIGNNNNKFYYLQLLEGDAAKTYSVFAHWGRVGDRGQSKMYVQDAPLMSAIHHFEKLFRSKTRQDWSRRTDALGGGGKYTFLERNYEEDDDGEEDEEMKDVEEVKSKLSQALQNLISLIFDTKMMQQSMSSMSYDAAKLPLGKLSKSTISQGYQVLKDIGQVIEEGTGWQREYAEYGRDKSDILTELSNRYYSIIPHVFPGRGRPTIIDSGPLLKQEVSLVENLADMVITTKLLKETKASGSPNVNILDKQFDSLNLNEATALDHATKEFSFLEAYVKKTHGHTHYQKLQVQEIFRVHRAVEEGRWRADGWDKLANSDRRLLWHGSRTTNFPGILSQGLRIAPPEAPVNGYMFDKGIYLADIVSKSANYCCAYASDNTGLLLLCEAQLGDPMYECEGADYHAATKCKQAGRLATKGLGCTAPLKWEDAGVVHEDLKGVRMPTVSGKEANVTGDVSRTGGRFSLQYNEYIVYNISQVKIRYLFRVKFS